MLCDVKFSPFKCNKQTF